MFEFAESIINRLFGRILVPLLLDKIDSTPGVYEKVAGAPAGTPIAVAGGLTADNFFSAHLIVRTSSIIRDVTDYATAGTDQITFSIDTDPDDSFLVVVGDTSP